MVAEVKENFAEQMGELETAGHRVVAYGDTRPFNFGVFFPLLAIAVYRLPRGVAAAVGGLQPLLIVSLSFWLVALRPRPIDLTVGLVAALGVGLVVIRTDAAFDTVGLLAALGANVSFTVGVVLTKKHGVPDRTALTGWQLLLGECSWCR